MSVAADVRLDHLALATRYAASPDDWPVAPRFNLAERWYHRLAQEADHEVWLLTWAPGQGTDLHDHGGSAGGFVVVSGELDEDVVMADPAAPPGQGFPRLDTRRLTTGAGRRFGPHHIHRVINRSSRFAVSVHVYGPVLTTMTRYRLGAGGLETLAVDRAGSQW